MIRFLVGLVLSLLVWGVYAQTAIVDLGQELAAGRIRLTSTTGNGASSGMVVTGYLTNETAAQKNIDVHLINPLYLVNSGHGQNMVAIQIYRSDSTYMSDRGRSFIPLRPRARTPIVFMAFCADFEKDNPSAADSFSVGVLPVSLGKVLKNIKTYLVANPISDITVAAQTAVWLAQGNSIGAIREKFIVSSEDERLARSFMN